MSQPAPTEIVTERYPGPRPFRPWEAEIFFGRDDDAEELYNRIFVSRLTVLQGRSGLGKTSLVNTKVLGRLEQEDFVSFDCRLSAMDPGENPTDYLTRSFVKTCRDKELEIIEGKGETLWEYLKTLQIWRGDDLLTPILVFDQFEEIFTILSESDRRAIIDELAPVIREEMPREVEKRWRSQKPRPFSEKSPSAKMLFCLREEFMGRLKQFDYEIPEVFENVYLLEPLTFEQAREAIVRPSQVPDQPGYQFECPIFYWSEAEVDQILAFLAASDCASDFQSDSGKSGNREIDPFPLQVICDALEGELIELKERLPENSPLMVFHGTLGEEKGMDERIEDYYRKQLESFDPKLRKTVQRILDSELIHKDKKIPAPEISLIKKFPVDKLDLRRMEKLKLIRSETIKNDSFYEITHDRLIKPIKANRRFRLPENYARMLWLSVGLTLLIGLIGTGTFAFWTVKQKARVDKAREATELALDAAKEAERVASANAAELKRKQAQLRASLQKAEDLQNQLTERSKNIAKGAEQTKQAMAALQVSHSQNTAALEEEINQREKTISELRETVLALRTQIDEQSQRVRREQLLGIQNSFRERLRQLSRSPIGFDYIALKTHIEQAAELLKEIENIEDKSGSEIDLQDDALTFLTDLTRKTDRFFSVSIDEGRALEGSRAATQLHEQLERSWSALDLPGSEVEQLFDLAFKTFLGEFAAFLGTIDEFREVGTGGTGAGEERKRRQIFRSVALANEIESTLPSLEESEKLFAFGKNISASDLAWLRMLCWRFVARSESRSLEKTAAAKIYKTNILALPALREAIPSEQRIRLLLERQDNLISSNPKLWEEIEDSLAELRDLIRDPSSPEEEKPRAKRILQAQLHFEEARYFARLEDDEVERWEKARAAIKLARETLPANSSEDSVENRLLRIEILRWSELLEKEGEAYRNEASTLAAETKKNGRMPFYRKLWALGIMNESRFTAATGLDFVAPIANQKILVATTEIRARDFFRFIQSINENDDLENSPEKLGFHEEDGAPTWRVDQDTGRWTLTDPRLTWDRLAEELGADNQDAPVVGVSYRNTLAYCRWLTNKYGGTEISKSQGGGKIDEFRLPTAEEWKEIAASGFGGGNAVSFPWKSGRKPGNINLDNFAGREVTEVGQITGIEENRNIWFPVDNGYTDEFVYLAPAEWFPANEDGIFGLAGNVSEFVQAKDRDAKAEYYGGSFIDADIEYLRIDRPRGQIARNEGLPFVGFRVVAILK